MDRIVRLTLLLTFFQAKIQVDCMGVEHLTQADVKCFPDGFVYNLEEREFVRLLLIPYLPVESIRDLSHLEVIPEGNPRYNHFLTCIWKDRGFQTQNGSIDFAAVETAVTKGIGNEVGNTGPGINLSKLEAEEIVGKCSNLGGHNDGHKVVRVRNCVLRRIKNFIDEIDRNGNNRS